MNESAPQPLHQRPRFRPAQSIKIRCQTFVMRDWAGQGKGKERVKEMEKMKKGPTSRCSRKGRLLPWSFGSCWQFLSEGQSYVEDCLVNDLF